MSQTSSISTTSFITTENDSYYPPSALIKQSATLTNVTSTLRSDQQAQKTPQQLLISCPNIDNQNCTKILDTMADNQIQSQQQQYQVLGVQNMMFRPPPYQLHANGNMNGTNLYETTNCNTNNSTPLSSSTAQSYSHANYEKIINNKQQFLRQSCISETNCYSPNNKSKSNGCIYTTLTDDSTYVQALEHQQLDPISNTYLDYSQNNAVQQNCNTSTISRNSQFNDKSNLSINSETRSASNDQNLSRVSRHVINPYNSVSENYNNDSYKSSISSIDSSASSSIMPTLKLENGKILKGSNNNELLQSWLSSIKCDQFYKDFIQNGYDITLLPRMTPQDLAAIGCRNPEMRKKLLAEIKKLKIKDYIPESRSNSLEHWLEKLKLSEYYSHLYNEGYDTIDKVCELAWEDFEDIGISKLGHQKRLLLGIEAVKRYDKAQEELVINPRGTDINPNHRMSLVDGRTGTIGRTTLRSGFHHNRSGLNLDQRVMPMTTKVPALRDPSLSARERHDASPQPDNTSQASQSDTSNIYATSEQIYWNSDTNQRPMSTLKKQRPMPPVRTESLRMPQAPQSIQSSNNNSNNSIYGTAACVQPVSQLQQPVVTTINGSTSFLRTPKLGTLTATTNKMLMNGGHIESVVQSQTLLRTNPVPIREAPLPPNNPPNVMCNTSTTQNNSNNINADEEEFPPPPPMSPINN